MKPLKTISCLQKYKKQYKLCDAHYKIQTLLNIIFVIQIYNIGLHRLK